MGLLFLELLVLACVVVVVEVVAAGQPDVCKDDKDCEAPLIPPGNGVFTSGVQLSNKPSHRRERLFRTFEGIHHVVDCEAVTLFNTTDGSVLYGPMTQMEGREAVNHRYGWEDGRGRYLFFMPSSGDDSDSFHGTWLVGDRLGVDSGTLFIKPKVSIAHARPENSLTHSTTHPPSPTHARTHSHTLSHTLMHSHHSKHAVMVPVSSGADPASSAGLAHLGAWKVLTEGKWIGALEVTARCTNAMETGSVYSGQYYEDQASASGAPKNELIDTVLVETVKDSRSGLRVPMLDLANGPLMGAIPKDASAYLHLDVHRGGWLPLVSTLDLDRSVGLGETFFLRSVNTNAPACVGTPVNFEWLERGFRVFFHCTDVTIASERYGYFTENGFTQAAELTTDDTDDITVELLEREPRRLEREAARATLDGARAGELVWLFYHELHSGDSTPRELLLECVVDSSRGNMSLFRYYEPDRRHVMRRTHVSRATALMQYHPSTDQLFLDLGLGHSESSISPHSPRLREVEVVSVSPLGADAVGWLKGFLNRTEGLFGGLPSCFLYHGAIGMPKPLVYAAELLCVLIGAKVRQLYATDTPNPSYKPDPNPNPHPYPSCDLHPPFTIWYMGT